MELIEKILELHRKENIAVKISNAVAYERGGVVHIILSYEDTDGAVITDEAWTSVLFSEEFIIQIIDERVENLKRLVGDRFKGRILQELGKLKEECKDLVVEVADEDSD